MRETDDPRGVIVVASGQTGPIRIKYSSGRKNAM